MKNILFPSDFSANANHAAMYAAAIADKVKANLILFNSFWVPVYEVDTAEEVEMKEKQFRVHSAKELKTTEEYIRKSYPNIIISILALNGFTDQTIIKAAKANDVDLIVMGTKGASGLKEIIMGSNTVDVINHAECPVMAIPENANDLKFDNIVFASNFSKGDTEGIEFLIEFAKLFDSNITIAHVAEEDMLGESEEDLLIVQKVIVKAKTRYQKKILKGDVIQELNKFVLDDKVDLLSVVTSKKHFLNKFFNKSVSQKLAFHTQVPLLVLHYDSNDIE